MGILGSILGGTAGGILGSAVAGGQDPSLQKAALSKRGELAIEEQKRLARLKPEDLAAEQMEGVKEAGAGYIPQEAQTSRAAQALGFVTPTDYSKALRQRGEKSYGEDVARLANKAKIQGISQAMENEARWQKTALAQRNLEDSYSQAMAEYADAAERARNSVISGIIGNIGTGVGYALAASRSQPANTAGASSAGGTLSEAFGNMPAGAGAGPYGLA